MIPEPGNTYEIRIIRPMEYTYFLDIKVIGYCKGHLIDKYWRFHIGPINIHYEVDVIVHESNILWEVINIDERGN